MLDPRSLRIKVFADGADLKSMLTLAEDPLISGFTTNPTLMRRSGVTDYATFAKELLQPGENLVQVAQHTRRLVSEMAETVKHKQIPVYFDQMVDDVFLNGNEKLQSGVPSKGGDKPADPSPQVAALSPAAIPRPQPKDDAINAPIAMAA